MSARDLAASSPRRAGGAARVGAYTGAELFAGASR